MEEPKVKHIQKFFYTTTLPTEAIQRCVVVFNRNFAVSFKHGEKHSTYKIADKIFLYNLVDADLMIEVTVHYISDIHDFIIFKSVGKDFPKYPHDWQPIFPDYDYIHGGIQPNIRKLSFEEVHISSRGTSGYYFGSSYTQFDDTGSGLFDSYGRIVGICVSGANKNFCDLKISDPGQMDFYRETKFISALVLFPFFEKEDDSDSD